MKVQLKLYLLVLTAILSVCQLYAVTVQTVDFDKDGNPDYIVSNKFFTAYVINPGAKLLDQTDPGTFLPEWPKEILNASVEKSPGGNNDHGVKFGLSQIFNPPTFTTPGQEKTVPSEEKTDEPRRDSASLNQTTDGPWQSSIEKNDKETTISYSLEVQTPKEKSYKLRIDTKFTDSSKITVKGVLFNTGVETMSTTVSPLPFFNINYEALNPTSWISIPIKRSFSAGDKKIVGINPDPIPIDKIMKYTEYYEDRISKAERWVAAGGIADKGICAILTKSHVAKIIFWKDNDCFSLDQFIRIEAMPNQRVEWEWTILFGKGLDAVSKVTESGLYSIKNVNVRDSSEVTFSYLPSKALDGVSLDLTLNTPEGKMIMNKNKEFAATSPQNPGKVKLNLSPDMKNKRYLLDLEFLAGGSTIDQFTYWLNPPEKPIAAVPATPPVATSHQ
jgi:hypothetical protein